MRPCTWVSIALSRCRVLPCTCVTALAHACRISTVLTACQLTLDLPAAFIHDFSAHEAAVDTDVKLVKAFVKALAGSNKPLIGTQGALGQAVLASLRPNAHRATCFEAKLHGATLAALPTLAAPDDLQMRACIHRYSYTRVLIHTHTLQLTEACLSQRWACWLPPRDSLTRACLHTHTHTPN